MELLLYDGTNTLNLADGVAFGVTYGEWTPNVARLRTSVLGGRGPYEAVAESIPLHARGATGAEALANVQALARMIDQAARWWRGEDVTAVQLWYKPTGSTLGGYLKNSIVPTGRRGLVGLSPRVNDASNYEIPGLSLDILRAEGQWLMDAYDVENHCLNSSFEVFGSGVFENWLNFSGVVATQVNRLKHGQSAARLDFSAGSSGIYQDITLTNGVTYTVSCYVRVTSGSGLIYLRVSDYGSSSTNLVTTSSDSAELTRLSVTFTAASGGLRMRLNASLGMIFEVDAVMVEEGSSATDYHPNSDEVFVATVTETGNPALLTADWSVSGIESEAAPVVLSVAPIWAYIGVHFDAGSILYHSGDIGDLLLSDSAGFTLNAPGGGTFATLADSSAYGGSVANLTPGAVGDYTAEDTISGSVDYGSRFTAYALINQASIGAVGYTMQFSMVQGGQTIGESREIVVDASEFTGGNFFVQFDFTATPQEILAVAPVIKMRLTPAATSATTLKIDYVALLALDEYGGVIALNQFAETSVFTSGTVSLDVAHGALARAAARVNCVDDFVQVPQSYRGNAWVTQHGYTMDVLPLLTQGTNWLYRDFLGAVVDFELTATRKLTFLTPE